MESVTAKALCGVMEKALIEYGVDAVLAKTLAERACEPVVRRGSKAVKKVVKRKANAANKKYSRAFAQVKKKFQKKDGSWKKNGFKNAVKAAHKKAKGMR